MNHVTPSSLTEPREGYAIGQPVVMAETHGAHGHASIIKGKRWSAGLWYYTVESTYAACNGSWKFQVTAAQFTPADSSESTAAPMKPKEASP